MVFRRPGFRHAAPPLIPIDAGNRITDAAGQMVNAGNLLTRERVQDCFTVRLQSLK
jgi:hypothetical protein